MKDKSTTPDTPGFDSILAALIEADEQARDQPVDIAMWTDKYPQHAAQIRSYFGNRGKLEEVLGPRAAVDAEAPTIGIESQPDESTRRIRYFGDYELLNEIARGGMGVVFKARQVSLNRVVAVKMILAGNLAGQSDVQRFHAEAESAANLDHPHIMPIYEVGEHEGQHYFSMKLIDGKSLNLAKDSRPKIETPKEKQRWAASLVAQVARAVHHAHQRGILHRDLKPGNILIDQNGEAHVTDFGLAKKVEGGSDLTNTGAIVGTPAYMAPEQARSEKGLSTAVDVYSLGAILYELLTDRPPFKADSPLDTILEVLEKEPARPSSIVQSVDRDLETIALKCLEKEPSRRFGSAEALAEELERWQRGEPITIRPVGQWERGWRWCRRNRAISAAIAAVAAALLVGIGLALWQSKVASDEAKRAGKAEKQAEERAETIAKEKDRADEKTAEARRMLGISRVDNGLRAINDGNYFLGLLWFIDQHLADPDALKTTQTVRTRFAAYWRNWRRPTLLQTFATQENIRSIRFSNDGQRLVTSCDKIAQLWNASSGKQLCQPLLHDEDVMYATFSPDNRWLLTVSADYWRKNGQAQVWDAVTGKAITPPLKHRHYVYHAEFSSDGRHVVTASEDGNACVWSSTNGQLLTTIVHQRHGVQYAAFSPDGFRVVTCGLNLPTTVWDVKSGQSVSTLNSDMHSRTAKFNCKGTQIVTCGLKNSAMIWDLVTNMPAAPPIVHQDVIETAEFSPDGKWIATASRDGTSRVSDATTGQLIGTPHSHRGTVYHANFSPDGRHVVTSSQDKTARIWDAATGKQLILSLSHNTDVRNVAMSPDGRHIATSSGDVVRIWDTVCMEPILSQIKPKDTVVFCHNGKRLLHLGLPGETNYSREDLYCAQVWEVESGKSVTPLLKHDSHVLSATFSHDARSVITTSQDKTARVWDTTTGQPCTPPLNHDELVLQAMFSPDNQAVATASRDKTARVWNSTTGQPITPPLRHTEEVAHVAYSYNGRSIVTASHDKTARVWDATTGQLIMPPLSHDSPVFHAEFSHDDRTIVTASGTGARVWDAVTGQLIMCSLSGDTDRAFFSSDDTRIVTTSNQTFSARVWDASTGSPVTPHMSHRGNCTQVKFSPDDRSVIIASYGNVRIWDVTSGQPLSPPLGDGLLSTMSFFLSPDSSRLISARSSGIIQSWDLTPDTRPLDYLLRLTKVYSGTHLDTAGGIMPLNTNSEFIPWFNELKAKYPADFSVTSQQARAWRKNEIAQCMKEGNLPAALFHQNWLLAEAVLEATKAKK